MKTIMNLEASFFSNPQFYGNGMVVKDANFTGNEKRTKWLEPKDFLDTLKIKNKRGQMFKKTTSLLYEYPQKFDLTDVNFIHFGMFHHLYSYETWNEFTYKEKPQQYRDWNAFHYFFKECGLKEMIWVYPDYYTNGDLMKHIENTFYKQEGRYFNLEFSDFISRVYTIRYTDFKKTIDNYSISYFTFVKDEPNKLTMDDLVLLKTRIG